MHPRLLRAWHAGMRYGGVFTAARWWHRHHAAILSYHGVMGARGRGGAQQQARTAEMFERQIAFLARHYHILSLNEIVHRWASSRKLPPYTAALTVEEGWREQAEMVVRILQKYHLPATIFLTTALVGTSTPGLWTNRLDWLVQSAHRASLVFDFDGDARSLALATVRDRIIASDLLRTYFKKLPPQQREARLSALAERFGTAGRDSLLSPRREAYLTWEELRALRSKTITFGSHTHTRALMSTLSLAEAHFELAESQRLIESELDGPCQLFSFPQDLQAETSVRDRQLLHKLGFRAALQHRRGFNTARTERFALRRVRILQHPNFNFFLGTITGISISLGKQGRNR